PVANGPYDMTASKYGYLPGSANGVVVTDGGTTNKDFTLAPAPMVNVNGVVKDAAGGWPLYAKVVITASGTPTFTLYTDPVTGYYAQMLVAGISYTFQVTSLIPGYLPGGGAVPLSATLLSPTGTVVNWTLEADLTACNAPGYSYPPGVLFESFSTGTIPPGWSQTIFSGGGQWRFPLGTDPCDISNNTGGGGGFAILDSGCDGPVG